MNQLSVEFLQSVLRIVTMNLEGAGVIRAIADKLHEDAVAATNMGDAARSSYLSSLSLIWRDLPVTVIDAEARQRYRETGMPQKSLPADLSLSLIADDRLAIVDDMPGMWAHELQGRVVRVAPYAVNASFTPEALAFEIGPPHPYLARITRDFSSVLNARGRVWPLPGYIATPPCLWGRAQDGLEAPPLMNGVRVRVEATTNNTWGHHGEMALPEVTLVEEDE